MPRVGPIVISSCDAILYFVSAMKGLRQLTFTVLHGTALHRTAPHFRPHCARPRTHVRLESERGQSLRNHVRPKPAHRQSLRDHVRLKSAQPPRVAK
eukprot:gene20055-biopygen1010